jgi:thymidylate synthase (FAD)
VRVIPPSFHPERLPSGEEVLALIERAGRTCYKSEDKIASGTAETFVGRILASGHESVIEHSSATVRIICDRGVTHELVRHRLASFSQESTRYANYARDRFGREITVIRPFFWQDDPAKYAIWEKAMVACEAAYLALMDAGAKAQEARSVLPNSLKTEIVMTANLREWRHVFSLRCDPASHPQMREVMLPLLAAFAARIPVLFDDLSARFADDIRIFAARAAG